MNRVEVEALIRFAREMCQIAFEGGDAGGGDIQDIAEKHGLLKAERFDPKQHADAVNAEWLEPGDTIYVFAGPLARPAPIAQKEEAE